MTKYLRDYESKMKVNLVNIDIALVSFITLVEESLSDIVSELIESVDEWKTFSHKMKIEFNKDIDKQTKSTFSAWVMSRDKTHGPIELLREFKLKLIQLPIKDARFIELKR